jgi:RNA polymerase sigma-70 factor (ECF subfamily)
MVGDRTQAEDIVQEAVLIAYQKLAEFSPGTNFTAWLVQFVRRVAANHVRKTTNRATHAADPQLLDMTQDSHVPPAEADSSVGERGQLSSDQRAFDDDTVRALKILTEEARCCLLLKVVQQLSYDEIAELLGIPAGTAMSHVHRAKKTMRAYFHRDASYAQQPNKPR